MLSENTTRQATSKRKRATSPVAQLTAAPTSAEQLAPKTTVGCRQDELALHSAKKKELSSVFDRFVESGQGGVVALVGPSGCGKATIVRVYAGVHGLETVAWQNQELVGDKEFDEEQIALRCVDEFVQYLKMECGVPKIRLGSRPRPASKVVLIRHLPTVTSPKDKDKLVTAISTVISYNLQKLVFLTLSDTEWHSLEPTISREVSVLHLNETAATILEKAISRMVGLTSLTVSKEEITQIRVQSQGDIRAAMNALLMLSSSTPQTVSNPTGKRAKKTGKKQNLSDGKDAALDMFHALGKFLIHKRTLHTGLGPAGEPVLVTTEMMRNTEERPLLYFSPEAVLRTARCDLGLFVQMLHENLLDYMDEIDDVSSTLDCFSLGDLISKPRYGQVTVPQVSPEDGEDLKFSDARICARGMLNYNLHPLVNGRLGFAKSQLRSYTREAGSQLATLQTTTHRLDPVLALTPFHTLLHEEMQSPAFRLAYENDRNR